jgi:hypothetical protein
MEEKATSCAQRQETGEEVLLAISTWPQRRMSADRLIVAPLRYLRVTSAQPRSPFIKPLKYLKNIFATDGPASPRKVKSTWTNPTPNLKIIS